LLGPIANVARPGAVLAHGVDEHHNDALRDAEAPLRLADEPWRSSFF
jgi:hypothetical protein